MKSPWMRLLCLSTALAALAATGRAEQDKAAARPNIVFIFADDLGLDGIGCYGADRFKDKTPNIDGLAKAGLRFERCYSTPLCGPSRCLLMTGRYGFRTGGLTNQTAGRPTPQDELSIAKALKQAGYATGMAGKWRQMGATPGDWGFDEYITDPTASGYYWVKSYTKNGKKVDAEKEVYYHDVLQDFAADFLQRHKEGPFYFYYPIHLVHGPILRTPDSAPEEKGREKLYDDNVAYMDKIVGKVVAEIDKLGLREKTLILFSVDNGTPGRSWPIGGRQINGQKGSMLEGGSRVALIANWKGVAPEGKSLKDLVDFSDFFPTFAELAGAKLPENLVLDGRSFAPQLQGQPGKPREWIFTQLGAKWYVRDDRWKLNESGGLYDMKDAPFVEQPVATDSADADAAAARKRLQGVLDTLNPAGGKTEPKKKP